MHEEKSTGKLDPKQEAALEHHVEQAESSYMPSIVRHEDDGSMTKMTLATVESVRNMQEEIDNFRQRCSDLKHALGEGADWFYRAKNAERELDQLRINMVEKHKIAKDLVKRHGDETRRLLAEIEAWKDASGLERGGDPDGVTPDDLRNEIAHLRTAQEKSWSAADEALLAEHEAERAKMCLVVEQFCRQCEDGDEPGSCPDCLLQPYGGGKQ